MATPYPDSFYIAHMRFCGPQFPTNGVWGDILDGPETSIDEVHTAVADQFRDPQEPPAADTLRVWLVSDGQMFDVLEGVIARWEKFHPASDE